MKRSFCIPASLAALALLLFAMPAAAAKIGLSQAREFVPGEVVVKVEGTSAARTVSLPKGVGVREGTQRLRENAKVEYAAPNFIATASAATPFTVPNDPGGIDGPAETSALGDWTLKQWNFLPYAIRRNSGSSREMIR